jgi:hypothetical protein
MNCRVCKGVVQPLDTVAWDGELVAHERCVLSARKVEFPPLVPNRIIETSDPTLIALRDLIRRMLDVPRMGDESEDEWKQGRASNMAQVIINDFDLRERR